MYKFDEHEKKIVQEIARFKRQSKRLEVYQTARQIAFDAVAILATLALIAALIYKVFFPG